MELLSKIVADCKQKPLKSINLFWMGDSFCNRQILEHLRFVRRELPRVKLYMSTNGGLLSRERSEAIVDEGLLDVINFDIDGATRETFEKIRRNLDFEQVESNVRHFLEYKKRQRMKKPETRVTIIRMQPNENEITDFKAKWSPLADKIDVNKFNTWLGTQDDLNVDRNLDASKDGRFDFACLHPWDELVIAADGRAGLCCLDYDLKAEVGNVYHQTVEEIWNAEAMSAYRQKMLNLEYGAIDVCRNCNAYIFQTSKTWAKLQR